MGISTGGVAVEMLSAKLLLEPGEIILFFKRTSIIITQKISENKINGWKKTLKKTLKGCIWILQIVMNLSLLFHPKAPIEIIWSEIQKALFIVLMAKLKMAM